MRIAVLMTCFNRVNTTLSCLQHLYAAIEHYHQADFDLWLNDDGSTDGTGEAVKEWFAHHSSTSTFNFNFSLHLIRGSGSDFWCGGMRRAWQAAIDSGIDYDGYLWLNDDTMLFDDAISEMLSIESPIVVGATQNNLGEVTYGGRDENGKLIIPLDITRPVYSFNGNCVLITKTAYAALGIFPTYFTHALGDFDYGLRAREKGIAALMVGKFIGICDNIKPKTIWTDDKMPLFRRWHNLHSPKGGPEPFIFFRFNNTHYGTLFAVRILIQQYIHMFIPAIWRLKK